MRPAGFHGRSTFIFFNAGVAAPFETREQFFMVETGDAAPSKCVRNTGLSLTSFAWPIFQDFYAFEACLPFWCPYCRSLLWFTLVLQTYLPIVMLIRRRLKGKVRNSNARVFIHLYFSNFTSRRSLSNEFRVTTIQNVSLNINKTWCINSSDGVGSNKPSKSRRAN